MGLGLAMQDDMVGEAYFYLSPYFSEEVALRNDFPESPYWSFIDQEEWRGAVLPLSVLEQPSDQAEQILKSYIRQNTIWMLQHLWV